MSCRSFVHFMMFFFPTMIMGNWEARVTMILAFLTGPLFTQMMAAQYPATYKVSAVHFFGLKKCTGLSPDVEWVLRSPEKLSRLPLEPSKPTVLANNWQPLLCTWVDSKVLHQGRI